MNITYVTSLFLIFLRVLAFFIALEVIFPRSFPNIAKIMLSFTISIFVIPYVNLSQATVFNNELIYIWQCICEVLTGLILGYFANLTFMCVRIGGQFLDFQMGYSMMSSYDPTSQSNAALIERLLNMFAVVFYFAIDGHIMLVKELVSSFDTVKLGTFVINDKSVMIVFEEFTQFLVIGVKIALPIILVLLTTDLVLGIMSRTVPQLNVMMLGIPVKILLGLFCLILTLPVIIKFMTSTFTALPDIYKGFYKLIPAALIFADADKTENATPKKISKAREEGQVARSKEVPLVVTLVTITFLLSIIGENIFKNLRDQLNIFMQSYLTTNLTETGLTNLYKFFVVNAGKNILMFAIPIMIVGIAANIAQTGFLHVKDATKPKLSKLNPIAGFKRMFSITTVFGLLKDIVVVFIVGLVGYNFLMSNYGNLIKMNNLNFSYLPHEYLSYVIDIFKRISMVMVVIAVGDYAFQKYKFSKDMKMSKHEVKDEFKQSEGDPEIKGKRRQKMREILTRTMMNKVPDATVVITNPTHIAVALKYKKGENKAPIVVAKGADRTALKIKEIAKENDVPIVENKPLARLMFSKVEVNDEIPAQMYQAVAEILAFVYKLKNKR